jgi:hypothetical protein
MRKPKGVRNHTVAPPEWRRTANITGDYEMDASILHNKNKSVPSKLKMYVKTDIGGNPTYGPRTAYDGYSAYSGDD